MKNLVRILVVAATGIQEPPSTPTDEKAAPG